MDETFEKIKTKALGGNLKAQLDLAEIHLTSGDKTELPYAVLWYSKSLADLQYKPDMKMQIRALTGLALSYRMDNEHEKSIKAYKELFNLSGDETALSMVVDHYEKDNDFSEALIWQLRGSKSYLNTHKVIKLSVYGVFGTKNGVYNEPGLYRVMTALGMESLIPYFNVKEMTEESFFQFVTDLVHNKFKLGKNKNQYASEISEWCIANRYKAEYLDYMVGDIGDHTRVILKLLSS